MGGRGGSRGSVGGGGRKFASLPRGNPATPEEALHRVNPHFWEDRRWQINCQRCVWAYEAQRRGYDVEARPHLDGYDPFPYTNVRESWYHVIENPSSQTRYVSGHTTEDVLKRMEQQMATWGEGSRAIVQVDWKNSNSGHVFNVERVNGRNVFYDAQVGFTDPKGYHRGGYVDIRQYISQANPENVRLIRSDKNNFTDLIDMAVRPRKKKRGE